MELLQPATGAARSPGSTLALPLPSAAASGPIAAAASAQRVAVCRSIIWVDACVIRFCMQAPGDVSLASAFISLQPDVFALLSQYDTFLVKVNRCHPV